jgi:hypothetical protein
MLQTTCMATKKGAWMRTRRLPINPDAIFRSKMIKPNPQPISESALPKMGQNLIEETFSSSTLKTYVFNADKENVSRIIIIMFPENV